MSTSLAELQASLVRLHDNGLRGGLPAPAAKRLTAAISQGSPIGEAAAQAGLDPLLAQAATRSGVSDLPPLLAGLAASLAETETHARRLRAAGVYPLVLAVSILLAGLVVHGVALPTLTGMVDGPGLDSLRPLQGAIALSVVLLIGLALGVLGRLRLPFLGWGWARLDTFAFIERLRVLSQAGAELPAALRAAVVGIPASRGAAAEAMAQALEAGRAATAAQSLLDPFETTMLIAAAREGTVIETTQALAAQHRVALSRHITTAVIRVHSTALVIAGLAVLVMGISFIGIYVDVLAR